jgi:hypothetical protein
MVDKTFDVLRPDIIAHSSSCFRGHSKSWNAMPGASAAAI